MGTKFPVTPANEMAFLVLGLVSLLEDSLVTGQYDFKQQFSKLGPWNMHWPTVHLLQQRFVLVLPDKYEQKTYGNSLAVRTFAERLSVNDILR